MSGQKRKPPAICAGCRNFRLTGGPFRFICLFWGVKSARYDLARIVHESLGHPCPFCDSGRGGKTDTPPVPPPHRPDPDRAVDLKI